MITLHGTWSASRFYLWGERDEQDAPTEPSVPATTADNGDYERHPNALSVSELHAAAGDLSPDGLLASIADETDLPLWLPCADGFPIPSNQTETGPLTSKIHPRALTVPALAFSPADTIDFLTGLSDGSLLGCSDALCYWRTLAKYAMSLLERQQFVPDLDEIDESTFTGRWRVFVTDREELAWLERAVLAMPPVCSALVAKEKTENQPARQVDDFLAATTEAVIRRSLANDSFFEQIHQRAEQEDAWELRWLSGLIGPRRQVGWIEEDCVTMTSQIRSWIGQLEQESIDKPPELAFTLVEPALFDNSASYDFKTGWRVRLELLATENGEHLDFAQVWQEPSDAPSILGQHLVNRRAHLHRELTRAATVFPAIKKTLTSSSPRDIQLDTNDAHTFLHEWAPLLKAQGFHVNLPDWATEHRRHLGLELFVRPQDDHISPDELSLGAFGLSSMLDFDWRVAVGDEQISIDEFEALTLQGTPLVRLRNQWLDIDQIAAKKALKFIQSQPRGQLTLAAAIRLTAGVEELDAGLPIVGLSGTSWINRLLESHSDEQIEHVKQPSGFKGTLRPYQLRGLSWLAFLNRLGIGACLADDMGLGKTIQLIALLLLEHEEGPPGGRSDHKIGPTLLFVPMSLVGNWQREIQKFAPQLRTLVHHGPERLVGDAFVDAANQHDVVITTYGLAHRDLKILQRIKWYRIALDEAQKIKNPSANQTIAVRGLKAAHCVALTGTPLENHLSELWSIMEMLNPGLLGTAAVFRKQFAVPIEKIGDQQRAEQLRRMIRPFLLRRLKTHPSVECDLPEKMEMQVFCNLTPEQAGLYKETVDQMLFEIDNASGIRRRGLILATLTKLKQICNHPAHFLRDDRPLRHRSGKCERIVEMLEEVIEEGDAALVFTQYKEMGDLLLRLLSDQLGTQVPFLHGGSSAKQREKMIADFQNEDSRLPIFLLSLKAGGFGLNLTKANHVFHFDRWWNPAVERQATDRVHRIGQTRRVQVHKFVSIGTIEDRIDKLLTEKAALADRIVGSGDEWLTGLSTTELKEYLTLSADAVAES